MKNEGKELYRELCKKEKAIPLFAQAWWLDIVCQKGKWDVCIVKAKNEKIIGSLPYTIFRYKGLEVAKMPLLTPYLKIWLKYPDQASSFMKTSLENKIIDQLISSLPRLAYFSQFYDYDLQNWLPFYWTGYEQTTFYSYRIETSKGKKNIYNSFKSSVRNKIRKAEKILSIEIEDNIEKFYSINKKSFERQGLKIPYSLEFLVNIYHALRLRNQCQLNFAHDRERNIHAANFLVWDDQSIYNLALGVDTGRRTSGAVQLLLWQGIKLAISQGKKFDFEGSMIKEVEPIFRHFGGEQIPYSQIYKAKNRCFKLLKILSQR